MASTSTAAQPSAAGLPVAGGEKLKKLIDEFNAMRAEQRSLSQKMVEIESDLNEHR